MRKDAKPIIDALAAAGIPYLVSGVNELFDTPEIKAMQAVFFFLADFCPPEQSIIDAEELARLISQARLGLESNQISAGVSFLMAKKAQIGKKMQAELYLQRVYLDFLEQIGLREENICSAPGRRSPETASNNESLHFFKKSLRELIGDL